MKKPYCTLVMCSFLIVLFLGLVPSAVLKVAAQTNYSSLTYSGTFNLSTTSTYTYSASGGTFTTKETCTVTLSFSNLNLVGGTVNGSNVLAGALSNLALSYTGDWSMTSSSSGSYQVSESPSSGHVSGTLNVGVYGLYENGRVVFGVLPQQSPAEAAFPVTLTFTDNSVQPPQVTTIQYSVVHPFINAMLAMYQASVGSTNVPSGMSWQTLLDWMYANGQIKTDSPDQSQTINFSGTIPVGETETIEYTGSLTLQASATAPGKQEYNIIFTATGLPNGLEWWVDLNGENESSTTNTIIFSKPDGQYSYTTGTSFGFDAGSFPLRLVGVRSTSSGVVYNSTVRMEDNAFIDGTAIKPDRLVGYVTSPASGFITVNGADVYQNVNVQTPVSEFDTITMTYTLPDGSILIRTAAASYTPASLGSEPVTFDDLFPCLLIDHAGVWEVQASASIELSTATWKQTITVHSNTLTFDVTYSQPTTTHQVTVNGLQVPINVYLRSVPSTSTNASLSEIQWTKSGQNYALTFDATGQTGTQGTITLIVPITAIPQGLTPTVSVDGVLAQTQQWTSDYKNYYISFTLHFSTHSVTISFSPSSPRPNPPTGYLDSINALLRQITQPIGNTINDTLGAYISSSVISFLFVDQPIILVVIVVIVLAIIIAIAAVAVKRKKRRVQHNRDQKPPQPLEKPEEQVEPRASGEPAGKTEVSQQGAEIPAPGTNRKPTVFALPR